MILEEQHIHIPKIKRPSIEKAKDLRERQKQYEMINKPWNDNITKHSDSRNNKYRDLVQAVQQRYFQDQVAQKKAMKASYSICYSQFNEFAEHARREKEIQKKHKAEYSKTKVEKEEDFNCVPVLMCWLHFLSVITIASLLIYG